MPRAYALTPRPKNLSTTAKLIHRLRHPLRIQRIHHPSLLPSNSGSSRTKSNKRRPRDDEWLEEPTFRGSPYELVEVEDKGEYTEQRYGDTHVYWESVVVYVSEEEKDRRRLEEENKRREKTNGRIFRTSEQLYATYQYRQRNRNSAKLFTAVPEQIWFLSNPTATSVPLDNRSHPVAGLGHDTNGDHYITLTDNTGVAELDPTQAVTPELTWNSTLTRILATPSVDPSVSSAIMARARSRFRSRNKDNNEVDMHEVSMVPNFSYPIANARWHDACNIPDQAVVDGGGHDETIGQMVGQDHLPNGIVNWINCSNDDVSFLDLTQSKDVDEDSLYRAPTPPPAERRTSNPGSIPGDILDPEELTMYQEIMSHNPRFTVLLEQADISRQVSLV